jgi:hypothetical protein
MEILDVEPGVGTLNAAIKQYKGDRIYRLKNGYNGYYVLDEIINNTGFDLTIIGGGEPDANDPKPTMPPTLQTSGTGGVPFNYMFQVFSNIILKDIYFSNATADGVFNTEFFMRIEGNNIRVTIDNCILDPAGNPIYCLGGSPKIYLTNNLFNRLTIQTASVNGPVNFYFPNDQSGVDTLYIENNTFVGLSTAVFSDNNNPVKSNFTWINHNTFIHHLAQIDWMSNQENFFFTNNLLYDCHVIPYEKAWVGGWDNYPSGSVSELLWSSPSPKVKDNGVEIDWGFDYMTSFVANNIEFKNKQFLDNLDELYAWTNSVGAANTMYFQPLVWTSDAPARGIELSEALNKNPQASVYNSIEYPNWKAAGNRYDVDPAFTDKRIKEHSNILAQWVLPAIKKDYFAEHYTSTDHTRLNWYWDPDGKLGENETWPLFDGSYTNEFAKNGGLDGLPVGDLNWFPEEKEIWSDNKQAIDEHILSLNTSQMDLGTGNERIVRENYAYIYPNPAKESFKIQGKVDNLVTIFDITGKCIKSVDKYQGSISISNISKGVYFVKFESDGVPVICKLIKN